MVDLARARTKLIHRWIGYGDVWVFVDAAGIFLRADQVEDLAGIPPWSGGEFLVDVGEWAILDGHACYPVETAIARCEAADGDRAAAFLDWLRGEILPTVDDDAVDLAQRIPPFIGSFPVGKAAVLLSEEPGVRVGRQQLFEFMAQHGWLSRGVGEWEITHLARRNGWLTVRNVPVPGRGRRSYPQTYVTPEGISQLRGLLAEAGRRSPPRVSKHPTLFD